MRVKQHTKGVGLTKNEQLYLRDKDNTIKERDEQQTYKSTWELSNTLKEWDRQQMNNSTWEIKTTH